jgi:DNA-binding IclR family transcriptional regulator
MASILVLADDRILDYPAIVEILLKAEKHGEIGRKYVAYGDSAALRFYNDKLGLGVSLRAIPEPSANSRRAWRRVPEISKCYHRFSVTIFNLASNMHSAVAARVFQRRRPKRIESGLDKTSSERYLSKAIGRALDVLDLFPDENCYLNLKEISARMSLPESSLFRILVTLQDRSYLTQDASGCYRLTHKVVFGKVRDRAGALRERAHPILHDLANRFNETASLAYLFETRIQVLDSVDTLHEVRIINKPGRMLAPHCSSLGKAITAFQDPAINDEILSVYGLIQRTPHTITDRRALLAMFAKIRRTGFAVDREEASEGGICIAAPIRDAQKHVIAAVSLSTPVARMTPGREKAAIKAVMKAAGEIANLV